MALLMLLGYLLCTVLLAWATLQQPYISKSLSSPPPQNPNNWVHSVIFKPQLKIQLTRSSYKVTSFLNFQPFLQGFQSVNKYLNDLWTDINNPSYFWQLFIPFAHVLIDPTLNDSHIENFLSSPACHLILRLYFFCNLDQEVLVISYSATLCMSSKNEV